MCQADPSLHVMVWDDEDPIPTAIYTTAHECVNWDRFNEWVAEQTFDFTNGWLVHPKYGAFSQLCLILWRSWLINDP